PANGKIIWHAGLGANVSNGPETYLLAVKHIRLRAVADICAETGVPNDLSVGGIEGDQMIGTIAGKKQLAGRGQKTAASASTGIFMLPNRIAGFIVYGLECATE